jgi:eukaryotic translation initiation factor 2C
MEQFAKRPDTGRNGQPVAVRTNMFEVKSMMTTPIFHYDVTVTPEVPSPVRKRVFEHFVRLFGATDLGGVRPIYDGMRNMFTNRELLFASRTFEASLETSFGWDVTMTDVRANCTHHPIKTGSTSR